MADTVVRLRVRATVLLLACGVLAACNKPDQPTEPVGRTAAQTNDRAWTTIAQEERKPARNWLEFQREGGRLPDSPADRADLLASFPGGGRDTELALVAILGQDHRPAEERLFAARGLALIGTESALQAFFEAVIAEDRQPIRKMLLGALDVLTNLDGVEALVSVAAQSTDQSVLDAVEDTVGRLASADSIQYLVELYGKEPADSNHAAAIARVLAGMKNPPAVEPLATVLTDPATPLPLFSAAANALGKLPAKEATLALVNGYNGELDSSRKQILLRTIAEIKDPAAIDVLEDLAGETPDTALREAAVQALVNFPGH